MAAVIKSIKSNIIRMKVTEEKAVRIFGRGRFLRNETQCVGNVHNVSTTRVTEFNFLRENLDSGR